MKLERVTFALTSPFTRRQEAARVMGGVRRSLNFYSRAIEKNCYSNDLENIDIYLGGICSLVRNSFYISAEITLYAVSNQVG